MPMTRSGRRADPDVPAERIEAAEEPVGHVGLEHHDLVAGQLAAREEPAPEQGAALDVHVVFVGAEHGNRLGPVPLILQALEQLHPDPRVLDLGQSRDGLRRRSGCTTGRMRTS